MKTTQFAKMIRIQGTFSMSHTKFRVSELRSCILKLEYEIHTPEGMPTIVTKQFDWNALTYNGSQENSAQFTFEPFEGAEIVGNIVVSLKGPDGSLIWRESYSIEEQSLNTIRIEIPVTQIGESDATGGYSAQNIRGKVLETSGECCLGGLTVLLEAKKEGEDSWSVVGSATTDTSGNFSMPYPVGKFIVAQAVVSLAPDRPVEVATLDIPEFENQTIANHFLYLMLFEVNNSTVKNDKFKSSALPMHSYSTGLCAFV